MPRQPLKWSLLTLILFVWTASAEALKADNEFARICNLFADNLLELHQKLIDRTEFSVEKSVGGYHGNPEFYEQEKYIDKKTGKVISIVTWESDNPENLHTIEVFVRDKQGRVIRDYAAAYLPTYRNAPTQTLISFHAYNGDLHAFRTFDAVGDRLVERCTGTLKGKEVNMLLDEEDLLDAIHGDSEIMQQPVYKACFKGLPKKAGEYLTAPQ
jgi:hypothetical protein